MQKSGLIQLSDDMNRERHTCNFRTYAICFISYIDKIHQSADWIESSNEMRDQFSPPMTVSSHSLLKSLKTRVYVNEYQNRMDIGFDTVPYRDSEIDLELPCCIASTCISLQEKIWGQLHVIICKAR